ncbi:hypothetical protein LTR84_009576 [Exophiala bonariae]|uniref:glutathione transferase n=1 Tax=Exophiala bonariae TaxID=1690606 RepID=A0AAV9NMF9_9EURO|nr:hypothetical protein LTR84_009576 [Exophiala bonariae]
MASHLYGNYFSTRSQRVLFTLEELEYPYEWHSKDFARGEHKALPYVSEHHPFGKVPAFQDDHVKLFESRAICRYLVARKPGHLTPPFAGTSSASLVQGARFEQAASVEQSYFEPPLEKLGFELIFKK